jgi:carboxymethylenebutenolidase
MCFDHDSRPPIAPIAGGALDGRLLTLESADGTPFSAFHARAAEPTGAGIVVLPDVRGLHPYYEELALRFAEHGIDAIAVDYFGRTAGLGTRDAEFEYMPHVKQTTFDDLAADMRVAADHLRSPDGGGVRTLFTIGFCFGGRLAFLSATLDLGLDGVIGLYGAPTGPARNDMPAPVDTAGQFRSPVLGLFGGADPGIPASAIAEFDRALEGAGVDHRFVTYPDAPHSFFDRKWAEFGEASDAAWAGILRFTGQRSGGAAG